MPASNRPGVTRQSMIDAALRLLDEVGLDGLSVRRLATELGVQSPALYWHIRGKQELLDGMADAIVTAAGMGPPADGEPWQDWLARRSRAYRQSLLAHRDGARIVAGAAWLSPATIRMFNAELAGLVKQGFPPSLGLRTISTLSQYINGFVLLEQAKPREPSADTADRLTALTELFDGDSSAPILAAIREGARTTGDEAFEHGLQAFIRGTAAALADRAEDDHVP
ncbi:TetR family transcriptional regulator [Tamaricihabitans halophyticus]|uniref:TetR family transcriptional regulator n=1 Tax=Tamaricihabitans halophyticus TaxID=1262583 RepID=A0A4R2R6M6_9PSEU|nr:TetR/AcrR family transcriptional regulator C-terminal domain-containing protein [Tamaricihabitans halophyticus]TCP57508.1 TetR family transcriptional regulator [Tamaricihabitans halophyticus]